MNGGLTAYGQVYIAGATEAAGRTPSLDAQLGYGPAGSDPHGTSWTWLDAGFNGNAGNNDEFVASINPQQAGSYDYAYRYSTTAGRDWVYADLDGSPNGYSSAQAGKLTVDPSGDTTAGARPERGCTSPRPAPRRSRSPGTTSLRPTSTATRCSGGAPAGPYAVLALTTAHTYTDATVAQGHTYTYVIRSVDTSWNRSANSAPVTQLADVRQMSITFAVTVPAATDATGRAVHIAGTFAALGGVDWDPTQGTMTRVDATHWSLTLTGKEGTQVQYKYVLGDWNYVEKGPVPDCAELNNRETTLTFGSGGHRPCPTPSPTGATSRPAGTSRYRRSSAPRERRGAGAPPSGRAGLLGRVARRQPLDHVLDVRKLGLELLLVVAQPLDPDLAVREAAHGRSLGAGRDRALRGVLHTYTLTSFHLVLFNNSYLMITITRGVRIPGRPTAAELTELRGLLRRVMRGLWARRRPTPELLELVQGEPQLGRRHVAVLAHVGTEGERTVGDLARELGLSLPAASKLTTELETHQLVQRREDADDRRRTVHP